MSLRPDPTDMSPDQRLDQVASILARGILRLHGRALPRSGTAVKLSECAAACLELPPPLRPDGGAGERPEKGGELRC